MPERTAGEDDRRLRAMIEHSSDAIALVGADGEFLYLNPSGYRTLGYPVEEVIGRNSLEFVHSEELEYATGLLVDLARRPGASVTAELRVRRGDGSWRWMETVGTNLLDEPSVKAIVANFRDITDRKRVEEALRENEERYRLLVETSPTSISLTDLEAKIIACNQQGLALLGYDNADEVLGRSAFDFIAPEDHERAMDNLRKTLDKGAVRNIEYTLVRKDGTRLPVELSASLIVDKQGKPSAFIGVVSDITQRKQAEETQRLLAQVNQLFAEAPDYESTLQSLARLGLPFLGDACVVAFTAHGALRLVAVAHVDPAREALLREVWLYEHPDWDRTPLEKVLRTGVPLIFPDTPDKWAKPASGQAGHLQIMRELGFQSLMVVPLRAHGRTLGLMVFAAAKTARRYEPSDLALAQEFATRGALALENAQLFHRATSRAERMRRLAQLSHLATEKLNVQQVESFVVQACSDLLAADVTRLWLVGPGANTAVLADGTAPTSGVAANQPTGSPARLPLQCTLVGEVIASRQRRYSPNLQDDPLQLDKEWVQLHGFRSQLAVPLLSGGRAIGALVIIYRQTREFSPDEIELLETIAAQAAIAIENARLYRDLSGRERRLRELVGRLLLAQEEERRRVAYEVHDGLAQLAAAAQQHLEAFASHHRPRSPQARQELDQVLELEQRTVREARRLIAGLRPTILDDFGLAAAIGKDVDALREEGWQISYDDELGSPRLPPTIETALFRVAQEALENVRKHAETNRVHLALKRRGKTVRLEVRDWGRGFLPATVLASGGPSERVGIPGMQERIGWLGGRCSIRSRPGRGTQVIVEVPLPASTN